MVLRIVVISAYLYAKTYGFDFKSVDATEDPFLVCRVSPMVISNETSPMDQERSPKNPTKRVFRSTLVAMMSVFSYARLFAIWATRLSISMGASAGAMPLSFLLSPREVSDDFVLSFFIPFSRCESFPEFASS
nr:hypothetical protein [Tanacetum cinerariifolium]